VVGEFVGCANCNNRHQKETHLAIIMRSCRISSSMIIKTDTDTWLLGDLDGKFVGAGMGEFVGD